MFTLRKGVNMFKVNNQDTRTTLLTLLLTLNVFYNERLLGFNLARSFETMTFEKEFSDKQFYTQGNLNLRIYIILKPSPQNYKQICNDIIFNRIIFRVETDPAD